jgi:dienelactone hydrolase
MNPSRDGFGNFAKFVPPLVANGKVYVATQSNQVAVYGLLSTYTVSPTTVAFGNQLTNVASKPMSITVTNTGTVTLPITSVSLSSTGSQPFSQTNTCGKSVAVGATCKISVVFDPALVGSATATLSVNAGNGAGTQTVALSGTGIVAGISWSNLFHYRWNAQLFAAAGYVVIEPNFHGSSGFGLKFMDSIKGQWGGAPYEDQMKAVDKALTWPYVDATRIAAAGASYGGYMANWVEGHTVRFRAIVSHDGLFDLMSSIYSSDFVGGTLQEFKGTPWQNPQALIDQAPVTYARNFRTPMLIVHGGNDYRVDPSQGLAMFQVLQAKHIPSKLLYFETENHWVLKPADSILWYHTVLDWLDQWVKPNREEYQRRLHAVSQ